MALVLLGTAGCSSASSDPTTSTATTTTVAASSPLAGKWERTGGDFSTLQGMVVEVDPEGTEGTILSVPRNPYRFVVGDVKWSGLIEVSEGRIRLRDLSREADTGLPSHLTGVATITEDGAMVELKFYSTGTFQVWTRIP
jgi:hypothetical protein